MVGPRVVGEGEKVRGECVVAAANEALGAREHCRCAQVDLHRGDGGLSGKRDEEGVVTHGARAGSCPGLACAAKAEPKIAQHCG